MSRILTFSRTFPAYHPRKGEPTFFVEAILTQLEIDYTSYNYFDWLVKNNSEIDSSFLENFMDSFKQNIQPKSHTIRNHAKPIKVSEFINPKCWAGKPYNKTKEGYWQIKFAPDIEVKKTWDFEIEVDDDYTCFLIDNKPFCEMNSKMTTNTGQLDYLAKNDGLNTLDLLYWFKHPSPFSAQIICWNDSVSYI